MSADSSCRSSPSPPPPPKPSFLKDRIKQLEKIERDSKDNWSKTVQRTKFAYKCAKFEDNGLRRRASECTNIINKTKVFTESEEDREKKEKEAESRKSQFRKTKSSFEITSGVPNIENYSPTGIIADNIFSRRDSELKMAEELAFAREQEELKIKQKKEFQRKLSLFSKVQ